MGQLRHSTALSPQKRTKTDLNETERSILEFVQLEMRAGRKPDGRSVNQFYFGGSQYHAFGFEALSSLESKGYIATEIMVLKPSIRPDGILKFNEYTKQLETVR